MVAVPAPTAVSVAASVPEGATVATLVSLEFQVTAFEAPPTVTTVAVNDAVLPATRFWFP